MKTLLTLILALFIKVSAFSQVNSFEGMVNNNRVDLKWATSSEKNIKANTEGIICYRLTSVTNDGIIDFSQVITISIGKKTEKS